MAETRTTRMRLVQWSEGTDSPQRVDFNETFLNIETLAAIDQQGVVGSRPTPNKTGAYYFATDEGILYRSDGLSWAVVGASTLSHLVRAARPDSVSFTVQAISGQTADLLRVLGTTSATLVRVRNNGDLLMGAVRISQAARTTTAADAAPSDSAVTVDNNSSTMWGHTAKNTTGNTAGYYRAIRGTSTVFSVAPDGSVSTPAVTLTSAPTNSTHATTKTYVDTAIAGRTYALTSDQLTGQLPVSKGGTGGTTEATARAGIGAAASATTISPGAGLSGGGDLSANRTLSVVFPASGGTRNGATMGTSNTAARMDHGHSLAGADIVGTLPVAQGGTNLTTAAPGAYLRANTAGDAYENVTPATVRSDIDAATSGHGHSLTDANITGTLPINQGGTGATTHAAARANLNVPINTTTIATGAGLTGGGDLTASRTLQVVFPTSDSGTWGGKAGTGDIAARWDHSHDLAGEKIIGVLPVSQGGTGATTAAAARTALAVPVDTTAINTGAGLTGGGNLTASRTIAVSFAGSGTATTVARSDHGHALTDTNITGTLPVNQGGTGATTVAAARTALGVPVSTTTISAGSGLTGGGDLSANRTLAVSFAGSGTATTVARSDHGHALTDANVTGTLPVVQGGTGATTVADARTALGVPSSSTGINTGDGLVGGGNLTASRTLAVDFAGSGTATTVARSDHGHALTDANVTGVLPVVQGGTGATSTAAARTALAVPVNTTAINTGAGLTGGGNLTASRTLSVVFAGNGSANSAARSDHSHAFGDITGLLSYSQIEKAIPLGATDDLNTYTSDGVYHQAANAGAVNGTNYPGSQAGLFLVKSQSSMVYQLYWEYSSTGRIYYRTKYSTTWYGWTQVATKAEIDNLSSVYAPLTHGHSLTDANITGTLPVNQGGTGATTTTAARTALGVPSTSIAINTGAGLSGGGNLSASRTLQVVFEGSGTSTSAARSDHGHSLTDANVTGILPVTQGGTGYSTIASGAYLTGNGTGAMTARTPANVLNHIGAAPVVHGHALTDANITGTLPVAQGGTGLTSTVHGSFLRGSVNGGYAFRTPAETLAEIEAMPRGIETLATTTVINDIRTSGTYTVSYTGITTARGYPAEAVGKIIMLEHTQVTTGTAIQIITISNDNSQFRRALTASGWSEWYRIPRTPYKVHPGGASGWTIYSNGISVVPHDDGTKGCSMEVTMARTDPAFTQGSSFLVHGYFVPAELRPTHVGGQYFWCQVATATGIGYIRWSDGQFSCRTDSASVTQTINVGTRLTFNLNWVV